MSTFNKLTVKQEKFCRGVATMDNHSDAYRAAYNCTKMKANTVHRKASELMANGTVAARVTAIKAELAAQATLSDAALIAETEAMAAFDFADAFSETGRMLEPHEMPKRLRAAVSSVKVSEEYEGKGSDRTLVGYTKEIKFWDKNSAQDRLYKQRGLFIEDNKQKAGLTSSLPRENVQQIEREIRGIKDAIAGTTQVDTSTRPGEPGLPTERLPTKH
jgi:phage terminase small subunit